MVKYKQYLNIGIQTLHPQKITIPAGSVEYRKSHGGNGQYICIEITAYSQKAFLFFCLAINFYNVSRKLEI